MKPNEAFDAALKFTLEAEGGYTVDQGGPTNHGVTQHMFSTWLKEKKWPDAAVQTITGQEVHDFYRDEFWLDPRFDAIAENVSPLLAIAMFDTAVNEGAGRAVKSLQEIVCPDEIDGILGPGTIGLARKKLVIDAADICALYLDKRRDYYLRLAEINKGAQRDLKGWLSRVLRLESYIRELSGAPKPEVHNNGTDIGN